MLDGVRPGMDDGSAQLLDHFAAAKGRLDAAGEGADLVGWRGWLEWAGVRGCVGYPAFQLLTRIACPANVV